MQQMTGQAMTTLAKSLDSSTGPGTEATTAGELPAFSPAHGPDCSATVTLRITRNQVIITAQLDMGSHTVAQRVFERRRGNRAGWGLANGHQHFADEAQWISAELAAFADRLPFPFEVANMLPSAKANPQAVAEAAREVAHG